MSVRAPTQEELIARALAMEAGNITEHRNYLSLEEEKRRKARQIRTSVHGPLLRWVSKSEPVAVEEPPVDRPFTDPSKQRLHNISSATSSGFACSSSSTTSGLTNSEGTS